MIKMKIYDKYLNVSSSQEECEETNCKVFLQSSQIKYSPFHMKDTKYLEHLHEQMKLRNSQEASVALRKRLTKEIREQTM